MDPTRTPDGRFAAGTTGGPGRPPGRRNNTTIAAENEMTRLTLLRQLAAGPTPHEIETLKLALLLGANRKTAAEIEALVNEHTETAVAIKRAAARMLEQELLDHPRP